MNQRQGRNSASSTSRWPGELRGRFLLSAPTRGPPGAVGWSLDDLWRIRIGDYRVIYTIKDAELVVLALRIAHRSEVYRGV